MKKIILICLMSFFLTGCSLVKTITAPFKPVQNTLPQQTDKSKAKEICKGKAVWNEQGELISCSAGYYRYDENYTQKERKLTLKEKVHQLLDRFWGYTLIIIILLVIFCPSALAFIGGRIIEGTIGITGKTLKAVIRGVQNARKNGKDLNTALATELDTENKNYIAKIKEQEKIK